MEENKEEKTKTKTPKILWIIVIVLAAIFLLGGAAVTIKLALHGFKNRTESGWMSRQAPRSQGFFKRETNFSGRLSGEITAITGDNITFKNSSGQEVNAAILETTSIYQNKAIATQDDLKVGAKITVFGRPNSVGMVQAEEIDIQ